MEHTSLPTRMNLHPLFDPAAAVAHLCAEDRVMADLIRRIGQFNLAILPAQSLFEALLRSIIYQQLHGRAAAAIHERILTLLASCGASGPQALSKLGDAALRAAGLSQNKLLAARDLAEKCIIGTVPTLKVAQLMSDAELEQRLTEVRGIGPWTVHMLLIFHLGRPDVMPTGDFAIRLAFKQLYRKRSEPSPATIIRHARCWQPYRSVASWYLWRSLDKS
jgi:DNA-3-methyladenine glycosylase II